VNGIVCPCISAWIFFCFFSITVSREISSRCIVAGHAVVFFLLLVDFLRNGKRINVDRDGVVQEAKIREALDDSGYVVRGQRVRTISEW